MNLIKQQRLSYDDVVKLWMAKDTNVNIAYNARCKDAVCHTIVKAMFEGSQGTGWSFMWALNIIALDIPFEQLLTNMPGNCIGAIESCIDGWVTDDESDYNNAMLVYNRLVAEDVEKNADLTPPMLRRYTRFHYQMEHLLSL